MVDDATATADLQAAIEHTQANVTAATVRACAAADSMLRTAITMQRSARKISDHSMPAVKLPPAKR